MVLFLKKWLIENYINWNVMFSKNKSEIHTSSRIVFYYKIEWKCNFASKLLSNHRIVYESFNLIMTFSFCSFLRIFMLSWMCCVCIKIRLLIWIWCGCLFIVLTNGSKYHLEYSNRCFFYYYSCVICLRIHYAWRLAGAKR